MGEQITRRAHIYARVSYDSSQVGRSVEQQIAECLREIGYHSDWELGRVYSDNNVSVSRNAKGKERPEYQKLMRDLRAGDVLVVWESSRTVRKMEDHLELRNLCEERGVLFCAGGRVYDFTDARDRLYATQDAARDEYEAAQTKERTLRSMRDRAAKGLPHSALPMGYRKVFDAHGNYTWEPDPESAPLIRELANRVLSGESFRSIAKDWNSRKLSRPGRGLKDAGRPWATQSLRQMIKRPSYAGLRSNKGSITKGTHPAIISVEEHTRIVALLSDPGRLMHRGVEPRHLLTGIARCGECPGTLRWQSNTGPRGKPAYTCWDSHVSRNEEAVDKWVVSEMFRLIQEWRVDALVMDVEVELDDDGEPVGYAIPADDRDDFSRYRNEARELKSRLAEIEEQMLEGTIRADVYARAEQKLLPQIAELEERARGELVHPIIAAINSNPEEIWNGWSLEEKRQYLKLSVDVVVHSSGRGGKFDPSKVTVRSLLPDRSKVTAQIVRSVQNRTKDANAPGFPID